MTSLATRPLNRVLRKWGIGFALLAALIGLFTAREFILAGGRGLPASFPSLLFAVTANWIAAVLLSPVPCLLTRSFPLTWPVRLRKLAVHISGATLFVAAQLFLQVLA